MKRITTIAMIMISLACFAQKSTHTQLKKDKCPVCKSGKAVVPIVYGKPGKDLQDKAERGEVRLGGCVIGAKSPKHYCMKDKKEF